LRSGTIFKDRSRLLPSYVPERLVGREDEFRELVRLFRPVLEAGRASRPDPRGRRQRQDRPGPEVRPRAGELRREKGWS